VGGQWRFAVVILGALLVAGAVWTWLPPNDATQVALQDAVARFETAKYLVWPEAHYGEATLSAATRDRLREQWHTSLVSVAEGPALEAALKIDPVASLLGALKARRRRVPIARRTEIVYFDFRRRTPRGELKVRAACDVIETTGRWDPVRGEIVDRLEGRPDDWCPLFDYSLRQYGDAWRVVSREATPGPNGGPPYFYNPATGEFTQDPHPGV
jgi:hypothetical protein